MYVPPRQVFCPACGSDQVEILAVFGTGPSDATVRCAGCRSSFAYLRAGDTEVDRAAAPGKDAVRSERRSER